MSIYEISVHGFGKEQPNHQVHRGCVGSRRYLFAGFGLQTVTTRSALDSDGAAATFLAVSEHQAAAAAARAGDLGLPHELLPKVAILSLRAAGCSTEKGDNGSSKQRSVDTLPGAATSRGGDSSERTDSLQVCHRL